MCLTFYHCCRCFSFAIRCLFNVEHSNGDICTKVGKIWDIMVHFIRVVTKISSCRVNTTSRQGIKRLGISCGSIFLLFSNKSSWGPLS